MSDYSSIGPQRRAGAARVGLVLGAMIFVVLFAGTAKAQCPDGSHEISRERAGNELRIKCACDSSYTRHGNRCIPNVKFKGNWINENQKILAREALSRVKDQDLRNWIAANVSFERWHRSDGGAVSANGLELKFRNKFFDRKTSDDRRDNLLAWEAGKVFLTAWQNTPLPEGGTLGTWFGGYSGGHATVIRDMRAVNHGKDNLNWVADPDTFAAFADVFRAEALQIVPPKGHPREGEWKTVRADFRKQIQSLLKKQ
jgi:hypothetical protein